MYLHVSTFLSLCLVCSVLCFVFFFELFGHLRDLHVLTHSFPTRRSCDLVLRLARVTNCLRHGLSIRARAGESREQLRQAASDAAATILGAKIGRAHV